jgi:pimeloyl-ACP methyl ester carboxylesterase
MPFVTHRGLRIHYTVEGSGPLVILQHGLFLNAESWKEAGIVDALSDGFRVACVDSLGHGLSDKPPDPEFYGQEQRSGDFVAVIDDLGYQRAHLIGHSMGGWLSVGAAKFHPKRLLSLVVGGWHPVNGLPRAPRGPSSFEAFIKFARSVAPTRFEWITPDFEPGVRACFEALGQLQGARQALLNACFPVMIWDGRDDPFHDPKKTFAAANGLRFLSTPGDHLGMLFLHGSESAKGLRLFLEETSQR